MNGGFNPIKDLYKMEVYRLCALAQRACAQGRQGTGRRGDPREHHHPAADRRAAREPDRPGLAASLRGAGRHPAPAWSSSEMPLADIVARGHAPEIVKKVERLLYIAEYKRRQAAPGREDLRAQLRPRPPTHYQQVPRTNLRSRRPDGSGGGTAPTAAPAPAAPDNDAYRCPAAGSAESLSALRLGVDHAGRR